MNQQADKHEATYDRCLLVAVLALLCVGLVMVTSASMAISERQFHIPFHYVFHQLAYIVLGLLIMPIILRLPLQFWEKWSVKILLFGLFLLMLVLVPGVGREVNGSVRWIGVGPFGLQVSEFIKLAMILYLAGYLVRRQDEVQREFKGFAKAIVVLGLIGVLLLLEPDFGATTVVAVTTLALLYLVGVRLWQFGLLLIAVAAILTFLAIASPYRLLRLTTFLHPWHNQFSSGYQLTQSLIAFGRGGVFGVGLGNSIQKLFYLPEAHTDFLFAVLAEELGLIGVLSVIALYVLVFWRALKIGERAQKVGMQFGGFVAYGIAVWFSMQAIVNMGVNSGLFPTKGLTLPFLSYGGSSMLVMFVAIGILFRVDYESRKLNPIIEQQRRYYERRYRWRI